MMIAVWVLALFAFCHAASALPAKVGPEYMEMLRASGQDEEFARLMGIPDASFVRPVEGRTDSTMTFGGISSLGDILLTPDQEEQARQGINFAKYPGNRWRNGVIPYRISTSDFTVSQRNTIESAIVTLNNSLTNLKMRHYRSSDNDYVMVISGRGCYANLGRIGGSQTVSLQSNGCLRTGTIQHEFIHTGGMLHEHMRPDRDNYIKVLPENIPKEWRSQYDKASSLDFDNILQYDYYSVMHYPIPAPGTGRPAFEVLNKSIDKRWIGQREGPSSMDIRKVDKLYEQ